MTDDALDLTALVEAVRRHLPEAGALRFLAQGEYSLNYVLDQPEPLVVRLVTGSQIGLSLPEQVVYEAHALDLLRESGRTPHVRAVEPDPRGVPWPFLMETFLPGRPLNYAFDLEGAAACLAALHRVPVPEHHRLQRHPAPGPSIVREAQAWAASYLAWEGADVGSRTLLRAAFTAVERDLATAERVFAVPDLVIVNYDVNAHNFIVDDGGYVALVDWEKARHAPATQDIAHFLLPTTTLWRDDTATRLTAAQEDTFLRAYLTGRPHLDDERFRAQLAVMRRLIALRAVAWCAWALWASGTGARPLENRATLDASRMYLEPDFLRELFGMDDG
jgi:thiamine kinase-like enzyme